MAIAPEKLPRNDPSIFIDEGDVDAVRQRTYRWKDQPLWPTKKITFTPSDRTNRRKLIEALLDVSATENQMSIGYELLMCSKYHPCRSPLCNSCRTRFQDAFEKRVFGYFGATNQNKLFSLTLLDDLTYDPINDG
jgi:hypothetical protein